MSYPADKDQFNLTAEGCEPNSLVITDDPIWGTAEIRVKLGYSNTLFVNKCF